MTTFMKLLIPLLFTSCAWPGTEISHTTDPKTGVVTTTFRRGLMAGPVNTEFKYEAPDGTKFSGKWSSDPNLDAWQQAEALKQANLGKALDLAAAAAKVAGGVP